MITSILGILLSIINPSNYHAAESFQGAFPDHVAEVCCKCASEDSFQFLKREKAEGFDKQRMQRPEWRDGFLRQRSMAYVV